MTGLPTSNPSKRHDEMRERAMAGQSSVWVLGRDVLALLDENERLREAARGALEFARPVDLDAAVFQGGFPSLREALR